MNWQAAWRRQASWAARQTASLALHQMVDASDPEFRMVTFDQVKSAYMHQIRALIAGGVFAQQLKPALSIANFTNAGSAFVFIQESAEAGQKFQIFRLVLGIEVQLVIVGVHRRRDC